MAYSVEIECLRCGRRTEILAVHTDAGVFVAYYCEAHAREPLSVLDRVAV